MAKKKSKFWSSKQSTSGTRYSSYWLSNYRDSSYKSIFDDAVEKKSSSRHDIYRLAEAREAIANFVRILTQRNDIKVQFKSSNYSENYTDGQTIVISPNLDGDEFDVAVGLALHEASHIIHTDFTALKAHVQPRSYRTHFPSFCEQRGIDAINYKNIWNCIEDFYIDAVTYKSAPGYRGYYQALYNKYFGSSDIVKGLNSVKYSSPCWDSYFFHLANIRNPKRNLNALPDLNLIWNTLDLKTISRLSSPQDRFDLTFEIYSIIERNISKLNTPQLGQSDENDENQDEGQPKQLSANGIGATGDETESESQIGSASGQELIEINETQELIELNETIAKRIENLFKKQQKYYDGDVQKGKITKADSDSIRAIDEMDGSIRVVCKTTDNTENNQFSVPNGVRVLVIKNVTDQLIQAGHLSEYGIRRSNKFDWDTNKHDQSVESGIARGKMLANKLQIRNEERVTKSTRLGAGTIDRRLLSELGFDNTKIFNKLNIVTYKPVHIHVSIDGSSSMTGERFFKSIELASALATASLRVKNLNVVVTVRGVARAIPYICYLFDSRKHSLNHIRNIFPCVRAHGTTPEGLTFEALEKEIKMDASTNESYFVNICDGQPNCSVRSASGVWVEYGGQKANLHCNKQMKKMESHGVNYIAYLLVDEYEWTGHYNSTLKHITECYGDRVTVLKGAHEIDKISKSFNKKLLSVF